MYGYFTKSNTFRYLGVINKLLRSYNDSVHSIIGLVPSQVNATNIYAVWKRVNSMRDKIPHGHVKFNINDLVRITKEKVKFAKGYHQNFSMEIIRVVKIINRTPQTVYQLADLNNRPLEVQFCKYELVKFIVSPQTEYQIDKILRSRNNSGIKQHLVKWRGYGDSFNSWINATDIKKI
jgi:hypothetical protein